jgi:nucleotide-binding universal stress UspA family protein
MSFKTIMTHVEPDWGSGRALKVAAQLARLFEARLVGVGAEACDAVAYDYVESGMLQTLRGQIDLDIASAKVRFAPVAAAATAGATWISDNDYPAQAMIAHAGGADLVVARRLAAHDGRTNLCHPADLITAAGVPVLICPDNDDGGLVGARVVVAWRDSREARRALMDAMPFLHRAQEVALVQVRSAKAALRASDDAGAVVHRLVRLGVNVKALVIEPGDRGVGFDLVAAADRFGADLIVAGAYSHMRLREWVLGGVTQDLLGACSRYVLFSH